MTALIINAVNHRAEWQCQAVRNAQCGVSMLPMLSVARMCVWYCFRYSARQHAFVLRLARKTNPTLENENGFIIDWVEIKWPDL